MSNRWIALLLATLTTFGGVGTALADDAPPPRSRNVVAPPAPYRAGLLGPGIALVLLGLPQVIAGAFLIANNPPKPPTTCSTVCLGGWDGLERGAGIALIVTGVLHTLPGVVLIGYGSRPAARVTVRARGSWVGLDAAF